MKNKLIYSESSEYCFARQASLVIKNKYMEPDEQGHSKDIQVFEYDTYVKVTIGYVLSNKGETSKFTAVYDKFEGTGTC